MIPIMFVEFNMVAMYVMEILVDPWFVKIQMVRPIIIWAISAIFLKRWPTFRYSFFDLL